MRIARDFGTVRELYPPGIDDLRELPYPWFNAIRQALHFLSFEELEPKYRPKKSIWLEPDLLKEHFEWVEAARKEEYGNSEETIEDPVQNGAAADLLIG